MVDVLEAEAALDAQQALARVVFWRVVGANQPIVLGHVKLDAAADAAVRAGSVDLIDRLRPNFLGKDRACRTGRETRAARGADRLAQGLILEGPDFHRSPAAEQRDGADVLHVVACADAARAQNALLHVQDEERIARVDRYHGLHGVGQREHAPTDTLDLGRTDADAHASSARRRARGRKTAHALDLDQTGATRATRLLIRIFAQLRH